RIGEDEIPQVTDTLEKVLSDVREAVEDWPRMHGQVERIISELEQSPPPWPDADVEEAVAFLRWLADNHFTFLGYREYRLDSEGGDEVLTAVPGTGFGILRADPGKPGVLPPMAAAKAREHQILVLAKANSRATVHRPVHLDYIGVKAYDDSGNVTGERRFLGLFSSAAYTESVTRIPLLRAKARGVLEESGFEAMSHAGKALLDVLETFPRDEFFATPVDQLLPIASQVMHTRERRQLKLFLRRDVYGRFLSCLVYLPRDRYNTGVRERISAILTQQLGGESIDFTASIGEAFTARLHFVIRPPQSGSLREVDEADLERRCAEAARSWRDDFVAAVVAEYGEETGAGLVRQYADGFPEAYKEDYAPRTGAADLARLREVAEQTGDSIGLSLYEPLESSVGEARLKVYRAGRPLSLSEILPVLSDMGVEVVDERPYRIEQADGPAHIYDFGLRYPQRLPEEARELFTDAVLAAWEGRNESDGFNALVLGAGLDWRQVSVLRAYARYQRQGGVPFAQDYIEDSLRHNVDITRLLVALFEARFDPDATGSRDAECGEIEARILRALDDVASLDHDRILRNYLTAIKATLRTNWYQLDDSGQPLARLVLKLDPGSIGFLPEPRPKFEIFVYSPRVEGVHLRFGDVARGGLRWSDRRDDFRTEVLGLVKAQ
ncbi:MAG: NAD-glutamate dehydrogenase, partial [Myxococcales bacterium]